MKRIENKNIYLSETVRKNLQGLRQTRKALGLRLKEVAEALGVHENTICEYERGEIYPNLRNYLKLGEILGWDMREDENYRYYQEHQTNKRPLTIRREKRKYDYSVKEIAEELQMSEAIISRTLRRRSLSSVTAYGAMLKLFKEAEEQARLRGGLR